ncbi:hypothetical protein AAEU32_08345 [Pseudoalteromonas sp. SSDWG2]|uniref:hypothetical protein n=1 Tax=Pseudoalteromonas sp. SSDWG2 TaxID=3139391 RepID=UPI003BAA2784
MNKAVLTLALAFTLAGCQNSVNNPELNQCAQQNFQCENSCTNTTVEESMTEKVCVAQCQEIYNRCKEQAQKLGDIN